VIRTGRLIALEGLDGCGKSTQVAALVQKLGAVATVEPGGTSAGKAMRALLLDPDAPKLSGRAEALLMTADRAQHVEEMIVPLLEAGTWVVSDRFSASTLAYQGFGRGMDLSMLRSVIAFATGGLEPDLQILIDVPVEVSRSRKEQVPVDKMEKEKDDFFARVRDGYLSLADDDPRGWVIVDGTAEPDAVGKSIYDAVTERLGEPA
jgi:dTMP kinase